MRKRAILISNNKVPPQKSKGEEDLKFAQKDAESVSNRLRDNFDFKEDEIVSLTGEKTSWYEIVSCFDSLYHSSKQKRFDLLIVGFWGYGVRRDNAPRRFFCGNGADRNELEKTAWSFAELIEFICKIRAASTMVFVDCCHELLESSVSSTVSPEDVSRGTISRFSEEEAATLFSVVNRSYDEIRGKQKIALFHSCSLEQFSYELQQRESGFFTYYLCKALEQKCTTARECFKCVYDGMKNSNFLKNTETIDKTQNCKQLPYLIHNFGEASFCASKTVDIFSNWLWSVGRNGDFLEQHKLKEGGDNNPYDCATQIYSPETGESTVGELQKNNWRTDKLLKNQKGADDKGKVVTGYSDADHGGGIESLDKTENVSETSGGETDAFSGEKYRSLGASSERTGGEALELTLKGVKYQFRWCPPGKFQMGSPEGENGRRKNEGVETIPICAGFWMLETPVTQKMWYSVMKYNPSYFSKGNLGEGEVNGCNTDAFPVESVSWLNVQEFLNKLNQYHLGLEFDLPFEEEWEYACRAGENHVFSGSDKLAVLSPLC